MVPGDGGWFAQVDQAVAAQREVARLTYAFFREHRGAGFSRREALELTLQFSRGLNGFSGGGGAE